MWYAGQPPWLIEGTIKENIQMDNAWCATRYTRVLRATALRPDLQLLPGEPIKSYLLNLCEISMITQENALYLSVLALFLLELVK